MRRVAELGQLYMEVSQFVQEKEGRSNVGTIEQSLCHHLQSQLNDYYRMVAVLESHASSNTSSNEEIKSDIQDRGSGLTLRRLDVWIDDWRLRMRMMSLCVEGAKSMCFHCIFLKWVFLTNLGVHGGALVSLIHGYTDTGDPFIRSFMDQLLEEVYPCLFLPNCILFLSILCIGFETVFQYPTTMVIFWGTRGSVRRIFCDD